MASPPCSPTLCRPQRIDRERVRAALRAAAHAADADGLLFHEAVVAAAPPRRPRAVQLLALTRDAVLLLPLGGALGGGDVTALPLAHVERFERAEAVGAARRALLLVPGSELYRLSVREGGRASDFWIGSFEPETRVFAHVARACRVHFQRRLLRGPGRGGEAVSALELSGRLEALLGDLAQLLPAADVRDARDERFRQSAQLLLELAAAASCNPPLQRLVLANKTRLAVGGAADRAVVGLPALLLHLLRVVAAEPSAGAAALGRLELAVSAARVLGAALFDSYWLQPERAVLLRSVRPSELARAVQQAVAACDEAARGRPRGDAWRVLWEELMDAQAALLLELHDALAGEAEREGRRPESPPAEPGLAETLAAGGGFWRWTDKLAKRVCVGVAGVERHAAGLSEAAADWRGGQSESESEEGEGEEDEDEEEEDEGGGSTVARLRAARLWSLALWRDVALLDLLLAHARDAVLARLRDRRRDYIEYALYLRSERFLPALRRSSARHLRDVARRLDGLVAAVDAE